MEWRINFKSLMLILLALQCVCSSNDTVYYHNVRPVSPQDVNCPTDQYRTLNDFSTDKLKPPESNTVTILIEGHHSTVGNVYNFGSPNNSHTLYVIGNSQSSKTVIVNELRGAITVRNMTLERFTASKIYLYIDELVVNSQTTKSQL